MASQLKDTDKNEEKQPVLYTRKLYGSRMIG